MTVTLFASKPTGGGFSQVFAQHPLVNNNGEIVIPNGERAGQTFPGSGQALTAIRLAARKASGASGNATAGVYATSAGVPTGAALATSTAVNTSALGTTMNGQKFTFPAPFTLTNATTYGVLVEYSGTGEIAIGSDDTGGYVDGQAATYDGSFAVVPGSDVGFQAITDGTSEGTVVWNSGDLSGMTLSNGDLNATETSNVYCGVRASVFKTAAGGKRYFEVEIISGGTTGDWIAGIVNLATNLGASWTNGGNRLMVRANGQLWADSIHFTTVATFADADVVCFAIDLSTRDAWVRKNSGAWIGGGDPGTGTTPTRTLGDTDNLYPAGRGDNSAGTTERRLRANTTNISFALPTGYSAWGVT